MPDSQGQSSLTIGLIGTYDVDNYGDCLFPEVYRDQILKRQPDAELTLYSPFPKPAAILSFGEVKALPAQIEGASFDEDCLILTGGETLAVGHSIGAHIVPLKTLSHYLRMWLVPSVLNGRGEIRFFIHSVGIPPSLIRQLGPAAMALRGAERITVRDQVSCEVLGGVASVEVDPVFLLPELMTADEWSNLAKSELPESVTPGSYLAVQVSPIYVAGQQDLWCGQVIEILRSTQKDCLFTPVCHFLDDYPFLTRASRRIAQMAPDLADRLHCLPGDLRNVKSTAALIGNSAGYIGSSLHGAVTAAAFGRPMTVFAGSGGERGKHKQTLLAAGIEAGVAAQVSGLAEEFARSSSLDGEKLAIEAARRAKAGFDSLFQSMIGPSRETEPVEEEAIAELQNSDRELITRQVRLTRLRRRLTRGLPLVSDALRGYRIAKYFPTGRQ